MIIQCACAIVVQFDRLCLHKHQRRTDRMISNVNRRTRDARMVTRVCYTFRFFVFGWSRAHSAPIAYASTHAPVKCTLSGSCVTEYASNTARGVAVGCGFFGILVVCLQGAGGAAEPIIILCDYYLCENGAGREAGARSECAACALFDTEFRAFACSNMFFLWCLTSSHAQRV